MGKGIINCFIIFLKILCPLMIPYHLVAAKDVEDNTSCIAVTGDGVVDLRPLANNDSSPRFMDVTKGVQSTTRFSWNPCFNFDEQGCHQVELCELTPHFDLSYSLGNSTQASFIQGPIAGLVLAYNISDVFDRRTSIIQLVCDENEEGSFKVVEDDPSQQYNFILRSKHCCPQPQSKRST